MAEQARCKPRHVELPHNTAPVFFAAFPECEQCDACIDGKLTGCVADASRCKPDCEPEPTCVVDSCDDFTSWFAAGNCKQWCGCSKFEQKNHKDKCELKSKAVVALQQKCARVCTIDMVGRPEIVLPFASDSQDKPYCCANNPELHCAPCDLGKGKLVLDGWSGSTTRCNKCFCSDGKLQCKVKPGCSEVDFDCKNMLGSDSDEKKEWCCDLPNDGGSVDHGWKGQHPASSGASYIDGSLHDQWCISGYCLKGVLTWSNMPDMSVTPAYKCPQVQCQSLAKYEQLREGPCQTAAGCEVAKRECCLLTEGRYGCLHCLLESGKLLQHGFTANGEGNDYCNKCKCWKGELTCSKRLCTCKDVQTSAGDSLCALAENAADLCIKTDQRLDKPTVAGDLAAAADFTDVKVDKEAFQAACPVKCGLCNPDRDNVMDCKSLFAAEEAGKDVKITDTDRAYCCRITAGRLGCKDCTLENGKVFGHHTTIALNDDCNFCKCSNGRAKCTSEKCEDLRVAMEFAAAETAAATTVHLVKWDFTDDANFPRSFAATVGDSVQWVWGGTHSVTFDNPSIPSSGTKQGDWDDSTAEHEVTFDEAGTYGYKCAVPGHGSMVGLINVVEAPGDTCAADLSAATTRISTLEESILALQNGNVCNARRRGFRLTTAGAP